MPQLPYRPSYREVTVKMIDDSIIEGKINIAGKQRVSEMFTANASPFITLVDVVSSAGISGNIIVNKQHIVWVSLKDES